MGPSREVVRLVSLDKSLWHSVKALEAGGLPAWELPLLGRAASAGSSAPPFLLNLAMAHTLSPTMCKWETWVLRLCRSTAGIS